MAGSIELTEGEWAEIYHQLAREYPASWLLIRHAQRVNLGFTVRRHREAVSGDLLRGHYETIVLDFYDDAKETWFRMKYL